MTDGEVAPKDELFFLQRKRKIGATAIHAVMPGETLYNIAQAEGIRLENLLQYNFLTPGVQVEMGEKLYLTETAPTMPKLATEKSALVKTVYNTREITTEADDESGYLLHLVQPKETIYSIARKYEVGVSDVKKWNDLASSDLKIGQQVRIKQIK